jgi:hypothetical protein
MMKAPAATAERVAFLRRWMLSLWRPVREEAQTDTIGICYRSNFHAS